MYKFVVYDNHIVFTSPNVNILVRTVDNESVCTLRNSVTDQIISKKKEFLFSLRKLNFYMYIFHCDVYIVGV